MSKFARGSDAAKARAKSGGSFPKSHYFQPKDGSVDGTAYILRFLTDFTEWLTVDQHSMVPTKPAPLGDDGKPRDSWPRTMGCVCRKTRLEDGTLLHPDCYVCDNGLVKSNGKVRRPSSRTWALACLREEVRDESGVLQGYRDMEREVAVLDAEGKPTGDSTMEKEIVYVNQGWKNFFAPLEGFGMRYGTVLDRDYWIKRIGSDTQTTYQIVPNDPQPLWVPGADGNLVQDGIFDLRRPEVAKLYESRFDIEEEVEKQASDDFYGFWFIPEYQAQPNPQQPAQPGQPQATANPAPPAPSEPDDSTLEAMRNRVQGYGGGATAPAAPQQPPAAPQPPAQAPAAPQPPQPPAQPAADIQQV